MPRIRAPQRVRINLAVSPSVKKRIERIMRATESETMTEVIRRALEYYEKALKYAHKLPVN